MKPANILLAAFLALAALAALSASPAAGPPQQGVRFGDGVTTGDLVLYREIDVAVARGENYYHAAARFHRQRGYPLKPFFTVRPPTLA